MYARIHTIDSTPEQHTEGIQLVREEILPWLRDSTGFRGIVGLLDPSSGKALAITLWADEESLRASEESGEKLGTLATVATGAVQRSLDDYEVTLFELMPGAS